jgi:hypothetical protein
VWIYITTVQIKVSIKDVTLGYYNIENYLILPMKYGALSVKYISYLLNLFKGTSSAILLAKQKKKNPNFF